MMFRDAVHVVSLSQYLYAEVRIRVKHFLSFLFEAQLKGMDGLGRKPSKSMHLHLAG